MAVKLLYGKVVEVFDIGVPAVEKLSKELSQPITFPVCPLKVIVAPFDPEQTVAGEVMAPPTEGGVTVIVTEAELAEAQDPLWTIAL